METKDGSKWICFGRTCVVHQPAYTAVAAAAAWTIRRESLVRPVSESIAIVPTQVKQAVVPPFHMHLVTGTSANSSNRDSHQHRFPQPIKSH